MLIGQVLMKLIVVDGIKQGCPDRLKEAT